MGQYGAQKMGGKWLDAPMAGLTVYRWQHALGQWTGLLKRHDFTDVHGDVIPAPDGSLGTLLVTARV
ncbi:hypothetical protein ACFVHW_07495 [Streptomyces sp. NPDC127110]|uniref:hypothetical protein n=1 Tax=Streptomyces sp. NPDC127110 TaxID=3345362 RepID=UPI0036401DAF